MDSQTITDYMDDTAISDDTRLIPMHTWDDVLLAADSQHHLSSDLRQNIIALEGLKYPITEHTSTFFEMIYVLSGTCCHQINQNAETDGYRRRFMHSAACCTAFHLYIR